jgi:tRNA C32,U32 (ribose-2'-O)-methylase TrmJ
MICSIPASHEYPVLNLAQAATIALYELRSLSSAPSQHPPQQPRASPDDLESFYNHFDETLTELNYPDEKHDKTVRLLRRLLGRANPTERELITLRGVLRAATTDQSD